MTNEELLSAFQGMVREEVNAAVYASEQRMSEQIKTAVYASEQRIHTLIRQEVKVSEQHLNESLEGVDERLHRIDSNLEAVNGRITLLSAAQRLMQGDINQLQREFTKVQNEIVKVQSDLVHVTSILGGATIEINDLQRSEYTIENRVEENILALRRDMQKVTSTLQNFTQQFTVATEKIDMRISIHEHTPLNEAHPGPHFAA